MRLVNAQPKHTTVFWVVSRPRRGRHHATIILKAAYRLVPDGVAIPNEDQPPVASGDDPAEPGAAPTYASDFVPPKPKADFLVAGAAHAPGGKPVPACRVSIAIGGHGKSLAVFGDRRWTWGPLGATIGEPEQFVSLPLGYERAFGGPGSRNNPVGRGADVRPGQLLPNIEHLDRLITQSTQRPDPAGFGPVAMTWQPQDRQSRHLRCGMACRTLALVPGGFRLVVLQCSAAGSADFPPSRRRNAGIREPPPGACNLPQPTAGGARPIVRGAHPRGRRQFRGGASQTRHDLGRCSCRATCVGLARHITRAVSPPPRSRCHLCDARGGRCQLPISKRITPHSPNSNPATQLRPTQRQSVPRSTGAAKRPQHGSPKR